MTCVSDVANLVSEKDEAITKAIEYLGLFVEECPGKGCDLEANYHWRGCRTVLTPFIQELSEALKKR